MLEITVEIVSDILEVTATVVDSVLNVTAELPLAGTPFSGINDTPITGNTVTFLDEVI